MSPSSTLDVGLDVHKDAIAVASVAKAPSSAVVFRGARGSRHCDLAPRIRKLQSNSQPLVFGYDAGPGGYWRSRS